MEHCQSDLGRATLSRCHGNDTEGRMQDSVYQIAGFVRVRLKLFCLNIY